MEFAATFDGYSIYGSSESVFETARVVKRRIAAGDTVLSMSEMRLWTFFEWRAQRHAGPELINDEIRRVLSKIRTMLEAQ
jgi:hypothetical protein